MIDPKPTVQELRARVAIQQPRVQAVLAPAFDPKYVHVCDKCQKEVALPGGHRYPALQYHPVRPPSGDTLEGKL